MRVVAWSCILAAVAAAMASGAEWPQFRGPDSSGAGSGKAPPLAWSDSSGMLWKASLPGRGVSSPIVVAGRVYVTASSGYRKDRLHVLCFDGEGGRKVWERQFWSTGSTLCHPKSCMAAPTPSSDGKRVFASYSTNDLVCLDLDGNLLWVRGLTSDYPNASCGVGMASSPLVVEKVLVVQVENQTDSFAVGLDVDTGVNIWKVRRRPKPSWSSPVLLRTGGAGPAVVLEGWEGVSALDPATGRELWTHQDAMNCIPSPTVCDGLVLVPCDGLTSLRPRQGAPPEVAWHSAKLRPATSSPLLLEGRLYVLNGAGILSCAEPSRGDVLWQLRLEGPYSSSPVGADGHVCCISESGAAQVVRVGEKGGEVVGRSEFGETILATPALVDGALFVRSDGHLWKVGRRAGETTPPGKGAEGAHDDGPR